MLLFANSVLLFVLTTAASFAALKQAGLPACVAASSPLVGLLLSSLVAVKVGGTKKGMATAVALVGAVGAASLLAGVFFDFSPDGTAYHQDAILALDKDFSFFGSSGNSVYVNHYPKLAWLYSAAILDLTGSVHMGKGINFLLMLAVGAVALRVFTDLPVLTRAMAAACLALNPVIVSQLSTHYVDGTLGAFLTAAILGVYGYFWSDDPPEALLAAMAGMIGCASLKHTGLVFSVLLAAALLYSLRSVRTRPSVPSQRLLVPLIVVTACVLMVNPYVKNLLEGKHLFHPALGRYRIDNLISGQTTKEFNDLDRWSKLVMSALGKTENDPRRSNPLPTLKFPFTVQRTEIDYLGGVDVRWGGWGPLFGGVLLVTMAHLVFRGHRIRRFAPLVVVMAVLSLVNPESWWARFNPQLLVFVVVVLVMFHFRDARARLTVNCLLAILLVNSAIVVGASYRNVSQGNAWIVEALRDVSQNGQRTLCWERKRAHMEPIFSAAKVHWAQGDRCAVEGRYCKELLGETICRQ